MHLYRGLSVTVICPGNISVNKAFNNKTYSKIIRKSSQFGIISNGRNDKDNKS